MFAYWLLFAFFALGTTLSGSGDAAVKSRVSPLFHAGILLVVILVGLRFEVGADWNNYKFIYSYAGYADFDSVMKMSDPGYQVLNWCARRLGAEIWVVNLICAIIFGWGLSRLARAQPRPWLAVLVAVPYLVTVVAMGYSRQAVAIGILMAGLAAVQQGASALRFVAYVAVAALFHKTAVVVLPLVIFAGERNRLLNFIAAAASFILLYDIFLSESVEGFVKNYVEVEYSSQGAAIRVVMNLIPAVIYLRYRGRLGFSQLEDRIWRLFSYSAFALFVALLIVPSSTAIDRLALYIIPLQIIVLGRVPFLTRSENVGRVLVGLYCFSVLFVWLNFAAHAKYWVPYQLYPF